VLVVSVLSLKGGVGKTSLVLGLAGAALERGIRTLVVDLDPQANATVALGAARGDTTVADVLDDPRKAVVDRAVRPSAWVPSGTAGTGIARSASGADTAGGHLDVLTGDESMARHDVTEPTVTALRRLDAAMSRLDGGYDLVLVDCPPSLGRLTRSALVAARRALVVTEPSLFAVHAADRAFRAVHQERAHNPDLQPVGVVLNRYHERSPEHRFRFDELRGLFGPLVFTPPLPERSAIQQAQGMAIPVQRWHTPGGREAAEVMRMYLARVLRSPRGRQR
jgi:chromosome partitioning protein